MTLGAFHSTKISGNSGPKLNGTVLSNRKIFGKEGPPFEVDRFFRSDRSDRKLLFHWKNFALQYLSVINFWKFLSETEWNDSVPPGWCNQPENFPIYCSICHGKFSKFQTGIFGRMESAPYLLRRGGVVVNALVFRSAGRWFDAQSLPSCCFLRQETLPHIVSLHPGV